VVIVNLLLIWNKNPVEIYATSRLDGRKKGSAPLLPSFFLFFEDKYKLSSQTLESLKRQISLFQSIINHANAVIGAKDLDGRYIFVNEEYSRLFDLNQEKFIGQTDHDIFPNDIAKAFREADQMVIAKNAVLYTEEKAPVHGKLRDYLSVKFPIHDDKGILFATGLVATDITERKINEAQILKLAHTDQLTQLSNRIHFNQRFDEALKLAKRENKKLALLMIDLDKFKSVNDTYGHQVGDKLLQEVSSIFKKNSREIDIVARLGGDEFAIILVHPENKGEITLIAQRIIDEIKKPILITKQKIQVGASISISIFTGDEASKEKFIRQADFALYEAKKAGRNTLKFYESNLSPLKSTLKI